MGWAKPLQSSCELEVITAISGNTWMGGELLNMSITSTAEWATKVRPNPLAWALNRCPPDPAKDTVTFCSLEPDRKTWLWCRSESQADAQRGKARAAECPRGLASKTDPRDSRPEDRALSPSGRHGGRAHACWKGGGRGGTVVPASSSHMIRDPKAWQSSGSTD